MVSIPKKVTERLLKEVGRFQKVLQAAKDRDVNESDTVTIITDMLSSVFGFDKYSEVTSEQAIRGTYCDLAVRLDGGIKYLIEVKAIGLNLKENHLRQAVNYGANQGIQWVILTNGVNWEIYRVIFEKPISHELICSFNFLELSPRREQDQDQLFLLCKEGLNKDAIEEFHEHVQSVNRFAIAAVVLSEPVLDVIRREIRRLSQGVAVTTDEIERILLGDVLKRDVVEGEAAQKARNRVKKAAARALRAKKADKDESQEEVTIDQDLMPQAPTA